MSVIKHKDPDTGEWAPNGGGGGGTGADGFSPVATVEQTDTGATITITDKKGTTTATVTNGKNGAQGAAGKSAYQYAQDGGYTGTEAEFSEKLAEETPKAFYVIITDNGDGTGTADKTFAEIQTAYNNGSPIIGRIDTFGQTCVVQNVMTVDEMANSFAIIGYSADGSLWAAIVSETEGTLCVSMQAIPNKTSQLENDSDYVPKKELPKSLKNPYSLIINGTHYDGSSQVSVLTPRTLHTPIMMNDDGSYSSGIDFLTLKGAINDGYSVYCLVDGSRVPMISIDDDAIDFSITIAAGDFFLTYLVGIFNDNSVTVDTIETVALPNPNALTINGVSYDGSQAVSMNIEGGNSDGIPDYVRAEAERLAAVVQSRQNADTMTFIAASDFHYSTTVSTAAQQKESLTHMGQAMTLLREMVHIDFTAGLGDMVWDSGETVEQAMAAMRFVSSCLYDSGIEHLRTRGNHDCLYSNATGLTDAQIFANVGAWNRGAVYDPDNRLGGYCYKDFDNVKIRVIVLNSCETKTGGCVFSAAQVSWLNGALDLSEKGDDWRSIILSHHPLDWGKDSGGDPISAINSATGIIAAFHGHLHNYKVDTITGTDRKRIAIPNACFGRENEYTTAYGITWGESQKYTKTAGTANDTAFCVITIDRAANKIYADRYGAGYDREIDYVDDGGTGGGYTNLVPTSQAEDSTEPYNGTGYKNGVYLSSEGGDGTDTACVATGYIPYSWAKGAVLYVKGADVTTTSHMRIYGYVSKGGTPNSSAMCTGTNLSTYFTVETLDADSKYYKLTHIKGASLIEYLRMSLIGNGENLIVTVNEPIE